MYSQAAPGTTRNRYALKEWAGLCDRLGLGEQVILVRKGGILEPRGGFQVEHREFFLFPTGFHEKGAAPPDRVEMGVYAGVEADVAVTDLGRLRRIAEHHGVPDDDVEKRFHYGDWKGVHVLALRAWRLREPQVVEGARAYDGCRSWVELGEERAVGPADPALDEAEFRRRWEGIRAILDG